MPTIYIPEVINLASKSVLTRDEKSELDDMLLQLYTTNKYVDFQKNNVFYLTFEQREIVNKMLSMYVVKITKGESTLNDVKRLLHQCGLDYHTLLMNEEDLACGWRVF